MTTTTITVLEPDFYKDFGCVGAACRSNCCKGWRLEVDKASYKKLRALREPQWLAEGFGSYLKRNPSNRGDTDYALLQRDQAGACRLQRADGLCRIHAELGADYLCDVCQGYPRSRTLLPDLLVEERGLSISCEEVARLLLAHPQPILFVQSELEVANPSGHAYQHGLTMATETKRQPLQTHFLQTQTVLVALLQAREYSLEQRMLLVVLLLDKLAALEESGCVDDAPDTLEQFVSAVQAGLYDELLERSFAVTAAKLFADYGMLYAFGYAPDEELHPLLQRCQTGLQTVDCTVRMEHYRALLQERGHLIEHLLVSDLWNKGLPFVKNHSVRENLYYLVATYAVLRSFVSGYLAGGEMPSDTELVDCIAYFGKSVLHNNVNFTTNIELLRRNEMTELPLLLAIIKG